MAEHLTLQEVRKVAQLARLQLDDDQLERYRAELAGILDHVSRLQAINISGVEPMAYPMPITNRYDDDVVEPSLPVDALLSIAPAVEGGFLAVPKVLE